MLSASIKDKDIDTTLDTHRIAILNATMDHSLAPNPRMTRTNPF